MSVKKKAKKVAKKKEPNGREWVIPQDVKTHIADDVIIQKFNNRFTLCFCEAKYQPDLKDGKPKNKKYKAQCVAKVALDQNAFERFADTLRTVLIKEIDEISKKKI